jgi:drug/metabolite transporter (DMT)-like permease
VTVVLWASSFVAIRSAGQHFSPGALALGRLAGTMVLGLISLGRREGWPPRAAWPGIMASGVLWFGVYMVALNWGERELAGGALCLAGMAIGRRPRHVHGSHSDDHEVSLEYSAGGHNGTRRSGC